jgi:peptidoglycan/xylan/chitin deacetylase (PgdA/CDA1 family)
MPKRADFRTVLKKALFYNQLLALYHRVRNRETLTVVVFHRVLPASDPRAATALPDWTVTDSVFEQCLLFFKQHYNVIGLSRLAAALDQKPLPERALLITFDDGYSDNEEFALPLLRKHGLPAVLFLTTDFVGRRSRPWLDDFILQHQSGYFSDEDAQKVHAALCPASDRNLSVSDCLKELVARHSGLPEESADQICVQVLGKPLPRQTEPSHMMTPAQAVKMRNGGIDLQAHGRTHVSLPRAEDLGRELLEPRQTLPNLVGYDSEDDVYALAFPFGDSSPEVIHRARSSGYRLLFTFKGGMEKVAKGLLNDGLLDRVNVDGATIAPDGQATPERLGRFFFFLTPKSKEA